MHYEGLWERAGCGETWRGVHWRGPRLWVLSGSQCPCSADLALPIPLCRAVCAQHSRISAQDATHTAASRIFVPSPAIDAIGSADSARAIRHNEQPPSPLRQAPNRQHAAHPARTNTKGAAHLAAPYVFRPYQATSVIGSADPARAIRHNEQPPSAADRLQPDSAPRILPASAQKARLTSPRLTYFVPIRQRMSLVQQTPRGR